MDYGLVLNDAKNVLLGQDQVLDLVGLVLGATILGEEHLVANIHR
jgi:hypothetical protein